MVNTIDDMDTTFIDSNGFSSISGKWMASHWFSSSCRNPLIWIYIYFLWSFSSLSPSCQVRTAFNGVGGNWPPPKGTYLITHTHMYGWLMLLAPRHVFEDNTRADPGKQDFHWPVQILRTGLWINEPDWLFFFTERIIVMVFQHWFCGFVDTHEYIFCLFAVRACDDGAPRANTKALNST